ncbi:MAG: hypothetical protein PUP91_12780 [Rhizonema sp. PD37]|nr:hypothetical protein [Rhizonema sp. PD37]
MIVSNGNTQATTFKVDEIIYVNGYTYKVLAFKTLEEIRATRPSIAQELAKQDAIGNLLLQDIQDVSSRQWSNVYANRIGIHYSRPMALC